MKKQFIKIAGYTSLAIIFTMVLWLTGCGRNNQSLSAEPAEEVISTEDPTEVVVQTEEPTEEPPPTQEPTEEPTPTQEPTEEPAIPEEMVELPPIMGKYAVAGNDPDYNNYEGALEITAANGFFQWNWSDREPFGVGLHREDVVSVAWGDESCNPATYIVQEDGVLNGIYKNEAGFGTEQSVPTGEVEEGIEGTYMSFGTNPNGGMYMCDLEVTRNGEIFDFNYDCGSPYYGVGIQRGNIVAIAYTDSKRASCMLASYLIQEDGTLDGVWAYVGDTKLGTDIATPETSE